MNTTTRTPFIPAQTTLKPGERLVPAVVQGITVYVADPEWCTVDHTATSLTFVDEISHYGADMYLFAPWRRPDDDAGWMIDAGLHVSLSDGGRTSVLLDDGQEPWLLNRSQALKVAANLRDMAAHLESIALLADEVSA
ncbi:hypothetical protein AN219_37655 [Streptomyces nanshensis]|nr:hypothetical protein AN219_37655 [Streptomyces nanshensis]